MTAHIALKFSRGVIASISCSYDSAIRRSFIEVIGTEGVVSCDDFTLGNRETTILRTTGRGADPPERQTEKYEVPNLYVIETTSFSDSILKNTEPELSALSALENQRVLDAIMRGS
jgi:predicted dehydrogenase